jgi:hypothetical protein
MSSQRVLHSAAAMSAAPRVEVMGRVIGWSVRSA